MMSLWLHRRAYSMIRIFRFLPRRSCTLGKYWIVKLCYLSKVFTSPLATAHSITPSRVHRHVDIYSTYTHIQSAQWSSEVWLNTAFTQLLSVHTEIRVTLQVGRPECNTAPPTTPLQHPPQHHLPPPRSHGDSFRQYSVKLRVLALADLAAERLCKMWLLLLIMLRDCNNWWCPLECNGTDVWCK